MYKNGLKICNFFDRATAHAFTFFKGENDIYSKQTFVPDSYFNECSYHIFQFNSTPQKPSLAPSYFLILLLPLYYR